MFKLLVVVLCACFVAVCLAESTTILTPRYTNEGQAQQKRSAENFDTTTMSPRFRRQAGMSSPMPSFDGTETPRFRRQPPNSPVPSFNSQTHSPMNQEKRQTPMPPPQKRQVHGSSPSPSV